MRLLASYRVCIQSDCLHQSFCFRRGFQILAKKSSLSQAFAEDRTETADSLDSLCSAIKDFSEKKKKTNKVLISKGSIKLHVNRSEITRHKFYCSAIGNEHKKSLVSAQNFITLSAIRASFLIHNRCRCKNSTN